MRFVLAVALLLAGSSGAFAEDALLQFHATWCGPCRSMRPAVAKIEAAGYPVQRIDVDKNQKLASRYRVRKLPTFVVIHDGKEQGRLTGTTDFVGLEKLLRGGGVRKKAK